MLMIATLQLFTLNEFYDPVPFDDIITPKWLAIDFLIAGGISHAMTGTRILFFPSIIRNALFVSMKVLDFQPQPLLLLCYILTPITVLAAFFFSDANNKYDVSGPYQQVGHQEFRLNSGDKPWVSVYYPAEQDEKHEFEESVFGDSYEKQMPIDKIPNTHPLHYCREGKKTSGILA